MTLLLLWSLLAVAPRVVGPVNDSTDVIILIRPEVSVEAVLQRHPDVVPLRRFTTLNGFIARVTSPGLATLLGDEQIASIEADQLGHADTDEAAALTGARTVTKELGLTGRGVHFALLDTGVDRAHPELDGGVLLEKCFVVGGCPPMDTDVGDLAPEGSGHGTHVAGIITGDGRMAPKGVAPSAELVVIRVFNDRLVGRVSDWVAALDWVLSVREAQGIKVVNMSLGTDSSFPGACDADQPALTEAVARLRDAGVVLFASSGNEAVEDGMNAPACVHGVISVGASYDSDLGREPDNGTYASGCFDAAADAGKVVCFSNSSAELDLLAPGSRIRSSVPGGVGEKRGTSQASPHAAAIAGLMLEQDPLLSPDDVEQILESTGVPKIDPKNGRTTPLVNALAALERVRDTQCTRRALGAVCELSRACDAGVCEVTSGHCAESGCAITFPAAESKFPAACGCSSSGGLIILLLLSLSLRSGERAGVRGDHQRASTEPLTRPAADLSPPRRERFSALRRAVLPHALERVHHRDDLRHHASQ